MFCCAHVLARARVLYVVDLTRYAHDVRVHQRNIAESWLWRASVRRIVQMVYVCNVCMKRSGVWLVFEVVAGHTSRADQTNIKYSFARTRFCSSTAFRAAYSSPDRRYFRVCVWLNCKYFPDRTHKHRFAYYAAHTSAMCPRTWLNWYGSIFVYCFFFFCPTANSFLFMAGKLGSIWGIWKVEMWQYLLVLFGFVVSKALIGKYWRRKLKYVLFIR